MRRLFALGVVLLWSGVGVSGQSPQAQPLLQLSNITYLGSVALPVSDGRCQHGTGPGQQIGCLTYGGYALGVGPVMNGQPTLWYGGHDWIDQLCQVSLPAIGGTAQTVAPCESITHLTQIDGSQGNGYVLGGSLVFNTRLLVTAFSYYPGGDSAKNTHFVSASGLSGLTGPAYRVGGSTKAGMVAGYMGTVPKEWQSLLGGPALSGNCCTSIISRSSYGPSVGTFDPDAVGKQSPAPYTPLVNYPDKDHALFPYESTQPTNLWNGSTMIRGVAFPSGTRSVLFIGRHGLGERCYGTPTSTKALHGTPHPQGERWCYDPAGGYKGDHAWPYVHQVWAYDANDLLAVKNGTRQPWEVKPLKDGIWTLPGMPSGVNQTATISGATYDDATRRLYISESTGGAIPRVHVYQIAGATAPPPPPVDCQLSEWGAWQAVTPWSACVNGSQSQQQQRRTRTIDVPPANGGAACGLTEETQTATQACTVIPPPVTSITVKGTLAIDPIQLGPAAYLLVVVTEHGAVTFQFPGLRIPGASRDLKKGDVVNFEVALNPSVK